MLFIAILSLILAALAVYAFSGDNGENTPKNRRANNNSVQSLRHRHLMRTKTPVN